MARAHRHFIPGQVWHLTHHCHRREFLLRFARGRERWLQWLHQARKRYRRTALMDVGWELREAESSYNALLGRSKCG